MSHATPGGVLALLGIDFIERPNRLAFRCPFHDDRDPSAGFYLDTALAFCFSCSYTLDVTSFYARHKEISRQEAERELTRRFGGLQPKREVDRVRIAKERRKGEARLKEIRATSTRETHAYLGEQLDRILLFFERGHLDEKILDTELIAWYNDIEETHARTDPRRTPRAHPDGRLTQGVGEIPGDGSQDGAVDLD